MQREGHSGKNGPFRGEGAIYGRRGLSTERRSFKESVPFLLCRFEISIDNRQLHLWSASVQRFLPLLNLSPNQRENACLSASCWLYRLAIMETERRTVPCWLDDRQTDKQTDRWTDRHADSLASPVADPGPHPFWLQTLAPLLRRTKCEILGNISTFHKNNSYTNIHWLVNCCRPKFIVIAYLHSPKWRTDWWVVVNAMNKEIWNENACRSECMHNEMTVHVYWLLTFRPSRKINKAK